MILTPSEIRLVSADAALDITWSDDTTTRFALAYLRGWCPCAHCQGHFVLEKRFITGVSTTLVDVEPVGSYAMRPRWSDGHDSGIYAFNYLRELAAGAPGEGPSNEELLARP
ncbi:MAG: DUF971 domain-containing protein [Myxococcales bacterium]|nr:DUF971 domain-containing protein [Myxococcales bacterium]MCB9519798.1 DUF971 domain-containing protein [Myxococcales bacterium]